MKIHKMKCACGRKHEVKCVDAADAIRQIDAGIGTNTNGYAWTDTPDRDGANARCPECAEKYDAMITTEDA